MAELMNIIDLISETHHKLRKDVIDRWCREGNEPVSRSEGHFMARVHIKPASISEIARSMGISRQAAQKCAVSLEDRGFLEIRRFSRNKRDKFPSLTSKGKDYIVKSEAMKNQMEKEITESIGKEKIQVLKKTLMEL